MAGLNTIKEPSHLSEHDNKRPDLTIFGWEKNWLVDVAIVHPLAPSHVKNASRSVLATSQLKATEKRKRYKLMADSQQATFSPFVCETTGGLHDSVMAVINFIAKMARERPSLYSGQCIKHSILDSVAIAIQRGNATIMVAAGIRARKAATSEQCN